MAVFLIIFFLVFAFAVFNIVTSARRVSRFQGMVFDKIEKELFEKIDKSPKPNKSYLKTSCDNCGAKCTNAADISPSGDLKCEYCGTWFNVLRDQ